MTTTNQPLGLQLARSTESELRNGTYNEMLEIWTDGDGAPIAGGKRTQWRAVKYNHHAGAKVPHPHYNRYITNGQVVTTVTTTYTNTPGYTTTWYSTFTTTTPTSWTFWC